MHRGRVQLWNWWRLATRHPFGDELLSLVSSDGIGIKDPQKRWNVWKGDFNHIHYKFGKINLWSRNISAVFLISEISHSCCKLYFSQWIRYYLLHAIWKYIIKYLSKFNNRYHENRINSNFAKCHTVRSTYCKNQSYFLHKLHSW